VLHHSVINLCLERTTSNNFCLVKVELNALTSIPERSGDILGLLNKSLCVDHKNGSEVSMRPYSSDLGVIHQSLFSNCQAVIAVFEEGVESVEDRGVAQVRIFKDHPMAFLDAVDEHGVHPLELTFHVAGGVLYFFQVFLDLILLRLIKNSVLVFITRHFMVIEVLKHFYLFGDAEICSILLPIVQELQVLFKL
jgi:hypothetical protein